MSICLKNLTSNYEISTLRDGGISGHTPNRAIGHSYASNYLSGTAIAIRQTPSVALHQCARLP